MTLGFVAPADRPPPVRCLICQARNDREVWIAPDRVWVPGERGGFLGWRYGCPICGATWSPAEPVSPSEIG